MITMIILLGLLMMCVMGLILVTGAIAITPGLLAFAAFLLIDVIFFLGIKKLFE